MKKKVSLYEKYRWLIAVTLLAFGTYAMFGLPTMKSVFYEPMRVSLGLTHEQFGRVNGIYGKICFLMYFPGGWLADKFDARKLLCFSYIASGALGLYLATYPSYTGIQLTFMAWGITTILTFWATQIKVIRSLGADEMQGKIFGVENGLEGVSGMIISFIALAIFGMVSVEALGLRYVLIFQSVLTIVIGIISYIVLKDVKITDSEERKYTFKDYLGVLKLPQVWIVGGIICCFYLMRASLSYISPYLESGFLMTATLVGTVSIIRQTGTKIFAGPVFGALSDKRGSTIFMMIVGFVIAIICVVGMMVTPVEQSNTMLVVVLMLVLAFVLFGMTGIGFAQISESKIPLRYTGAAAGLISVIGYVPDTFYYDIAGSWIENYGIAGYQRIFMLSAVVGVAGIILSIVLSRLIKKLKAESENA
mgnify:FL=1